MASKLGERAVCVNQSLSLGILRGAACHGSWGEEPTPNFWSPGSCCSQPDAPWQDFSGCRVLSPRCGADQEPPERTNCNEHFPLWSAGPSILGAGSRTCSITGTTGTPLVSAQWPQGIGKVQLKVRGALIQTVTPIPVISHLGTAKENTSLWIGFLV